MLSDSVSEFVCFFGDGSAESFEGLFSVPRAAVRSAETFNDVDDFVEVVRCINDKFLLCVCGWR